jgi:hypothetical protein
MLIPDQISFSRVDIPVLISAVSTTATTGTVAYTGYGAIYTRNGSTLTPIVGKSQSTSFSYSSNAGSYASITGPRVVSFSLATSLTAGEYYFGFQLATAGSTQGWSFAPIYGSSYSAAAWADINSAQNNTVNPFQPFQGINSVAALTATSQTIQQSQLGQSGNNALLANIIVNLRNV